MITGDALHVAHWSPTLASVLILPHAIFVAVEQAAGFFPRDASMRWADVSRDR